MTIKEAQQLVAAWNEKNSDRGSEPTHPSRHLSLLPDAQDISGSADNPGMGDTPRSDESPGHLFWRLLTYSNAAGVDLTDALINTLADKNDRG